MAPSQTTKSVPPKKSKSTLSTLKLGSFPTGLTESTSIPKPLSTVTRRASKGLKPLARPPNFQFNGKGKEKMSTSSELESHQDSIREPQLWVDQYAPETETELAVHKRKVEDVRRWLLEAFEGGPSGSLKKYRRILALTGHAGTGKTATLRVLAKEMDFTIIEWRNSLDDIFWGDDDEYGRESLITKFQNFITRASACCPLPLTNMSTTSSGAQRHPRQIILLEDLPNILHADTAEAFHRALEEYMGSTPGIPIVCVISDAGIRGEDPDNDMVGGSTAWGKGGNKALDIRNVIPHTILHTPYFQEIQFNPIASSLMTKALTTLLTRHFLTVRPKKLTQPTKETIKIVVESSHGDIRSAIMALEFACTLQLPRGNKKGDARLVLEAVTRREQSLALFHMLGKVLYNKRKGDRHFIHAANTVKDSEKEDEEDKMICDPPPLPSHLKEHSRRGSRVDVNMLYADSPVDASLFALYLHQNYTQFCDDVDECGGICDSLSWIDGSGIESWQLQRNPYQFHHLTLGTLHSLPSPVPRRSQKMFKPEYFEVLKRTHEAEGGVADTEKWLDGLMTSEGVTVTVSGRRWARQEVVLELGGVLKALEAQNKGAIPQSHTKFSTLSFVHPAKLPMNPRTQQLGESEDASEEVTVGDTSGGHSRAWAGFRPDTGSTGGWLETDDIQEF